MAWHCITWEAYLRWENRGSRRGSSEPVQGVRPSGNPFYKVKAGGCGGSAGGCVYCTCNGAKPCLITSIFGRCLCAVSGMSCTRYDTSSCPARHVPGISFFVFVQ